MPAKRLTRPEGAIPRTGIVHFGPGAFFRAFGAVYTHEVQQNEGGDWGICAVSLRSPNFRDLLAPQGGAYSAVELGPERSEIQVITSITEVLVAPEDPELVLVRMSDPAVKIVSLTITEKGYCHEPATGALRQEDPDIVSDIAGNPPKSAIGFIVEALARRRAQGGDPFTVMTCDNLPNNGALVKEVVLEFARLRDPGLADWIDECVCFPSTMVDRITPATTQADIDRLEDGAGYFDPANVQHEPFRQWVIEDNFVNGARPNWEKFGAQMVQDVEPFEHMKLRCLNGTHSTLAYLGYLAGYKTIAETVADPDFADLCTKLWDTEITPSLTPPENVDLSAYCAALLDRYRNPSIRHRTWQIAMDGSQKLPQRILGTISDNRAAGRAISGLSLAVAGWMRYVGGVDEQGNEIDVKDPLAEILKSASESGQTPEEKVAALIALDEVFPKSLQADEKFRVTVTEAYANLLTNGSKNSVKALI